MWVRWTRVVAGVKTVLPKTQETIGLLERYLLTEEDRNLLNRQEQYKATGTVESEAEEGEPQDDDFRRTQIAAEEDDKAFRQRPVWWVVGTSLGFEAAVLGIACLIFARRDF